MGKQIKKGRESKLSKRKLRNQAKNKEDPVRKIRSKPQNSFIKNLIKRKIANNYRKQKQTKLIEPSIKSQQNELPQEKKVIKLKILQRKAASNGKTRSGKWFREKQNSVQKQQNDINNQQQMQQEQPNNKNQNEIIIEQEKQDKQSQMIIENAIFINDDPPIYKRKKNNLQIRSSENTEYSPKQFSAEDTFISNPKASIDSKKSFLYEEISETHNNYFPSTFLLNNNNKFQHAYQTKQKNQAYSNFNLQNICKNEIQNLNNYESLNQLKGNLQNSKINMMETNNIKQKQYYDMQPLQSYQQYQNPIMLPMNTNQQYQQQQKQQVKQHQKNKNFINKDQNNNFNCISSSNKMINIIEDQIEVKQDFGIKYSPKQFVVSQFSYNSSKSPLRQKMKQQILKKIDFVICCDTTSSMDSYINCCKDIVDETYQQLMVKFKGDISIQYGYVAYRDHPPEDMTYVTKVHNLSSKEKVLDFIDVLDSNGGGDLPEAVMDGLWQSVQGISWRAQSIKYLIHICDAPPHGDKYTGLCILKRSFMWRFGCPCGLRIEKIADCFNKLGIRYRLVKIGDLLENMSKIFQKYIQDYEDISVTSASNLDIYIANMLIQETIPDEIEHLQNQIY